MKAFLLLAFFGFASAAIEIAPYEVILTESDYEVRRYPQRKWVATSLDAYTYNEANGQLFNTLFQYIDGANDRAEAIPMTAPVSTLIVPGEGPNCMQTFKMAFYIPDAFQSNPPLPTDPNVYIEDRAEFELYARQFTGYAQESDWINEALNLQASLLRDGITDAQYAPWYIAGYDSPFELVNRRNEIWFVRVQPPRISKD